MPRPGPRRPVVAIRLHDSGIDYLDQWAADENITRSELIRQIIARAVNARQARKGK